MSTGRKSAVAIVRCEDYLPAHVEAAVGEAVGLLPEMCEKIARTSSVLLKINLTQLCADDTAVTTHSSVVRAAALAVTRLGPKVTIGESSGGSGWPLWRRLHKQLYARLASTMKGMRFEQLEDFYNYIMNLRSFGDVLKLHAPGLVQPFTNAEELGVDTEIDFYGKCGILDAAKESGAGLSYFDMEEAVPVKTRSHRFIPEVNVCRPVFDAEQIVSVAKFKTHSDAVITGALKNFFGIVPTPLRAGLHGAAMFGGMLSEMILDVYSTVSPPPFAITDAVLGMEGKGPLEGRPRRLGAIMASDDCVAHDAVMAALMGLDPMKVPLVRLAHEHGLGQGRLENIEVRGVPVEELRVADWDLERNGSLR